MKDQDKTYTKEELREILKDSHLVFCHEYIIDWNGSRSYKAAYPEAEDDTARVNASKLLTNTNIKSYIALIKDDIEQECNISKIKQVKTLQDIINDKEATHRDRATALQELNKMLGYNSPDRLDVTTQGDKIQESSIKLSVDGKDIELK